jgi:hypothetical protein
MYDSHPHERLCMREHLGNGVCWVCVIFFACVCVGASDLTTTSDDPFWAFLLF